MKGIVFFTSVLLTWTSWAGLPAQKNVTEMVDYYKTYSLSRCILNNYKSMGVDFNKIPLKDYTIGFIDIEIGLGLTFGEHENNKLDTFIRNKTGQFYKPKQASGDLAFINLVTLDCIDFYKSKELDTFLNKIIKEKVDDISREERVDANQ